MSETGLLIAEASFLALLYVFIWSIVRTSSKDLRETAPVAPVALPNVPVHAGDTGAQAAVVAPAAAVAEPVAESGASRERPTGPVFELSVNIDPRLIVHRSPSLATGLEFTLEAGMTIGRSRSNGIALSDQFASHMHARVFPNGHFFYIEDLGSTNGTFLNGRRIEGQAQLKGHDEIRIGETLLRYEE